MQVGRRFDTTFMSQQLPITALYELAAPSVPDELVADILSSNTPIKANLYVLGSYEIDIGKWSVQMYTPVNRLLHNLLCTKPLCC